MNTKTIVTIAAIAAVGYFIYTRRKSGKSLNPFSSFTADEDTFFNVSGIGGGKGKRVNYIAGGYDAGHQNPDGTRGATWISYGGAGHLGYWQSGYVPQGTQVTRK